MKRLFVNIESFFSPQRHRVNRENHSRCKILSFCFILLISSGLVRAELFVHQLKHQSAINTIPLIQPHLSKQSSLTAKDFQLFLSGTKEDNQKVIDILQAIDIKPSEYFVEVKILKHKMDDHQFNLVKNELNNLNRKTKINKIQLDNHQNASNHFNLRMTENYQAFIATGESFPDHKIISQYGHLLPSSGRTKTSSGFYMLIQPSSAPKDERITVRVSAQQQQKINSAQQLESSYASTKFSEVKGKWILIASNAEGKTSLSDKRYSTNDQSSKERWYYVRVTDVAAPLNTQQSTDKM